MELIPTSRIISNFFDKLGAGQSPKDPLPGGKGLLGIHLQLTLQTGGWRGSDAIG
jgi:hypothetical protein